MTEYQPASLQEALTFILNADERELKMISSALTARRKVMVEQKALLNASQMYVGSRVRLSYDIRPKKIAGKTGTIKRIEANGKMVVELDYPIDKWVRPVCEPSHLELL